MSTELKTVAWMRRWAIDGETPAKVKNTNGRWAWPAKFKLLAVTPGRCCDDDGALVDRSEAEAEIARLRQALQRIGSIENNPFGQDWQEIEEARRIANGTLNPGEQDGR